MGLAVWFARHPGVEIEHLGLIPMFFREEDPRPAKDQIEERYAHGGGWSPFGQGKWRMTPTGKLKYPGDEALPILAECFLNGETLRFYAMSLLAVVQPNGDFEVCRLD